MSTTACQNCGLTIHSHKTHSCEQEHAVTHEPECPCVYCHLERKFASYNRENPQDEQANHLQANLAICKFINEEYENADRERRNELIDIIENSKTELAKYLDELHLRKFLYKACQNPKTLGDVTEVFKSFNWTNFLDRLLRLY